MKRTRLTPPTLMFALAILPMVLGASAAQAKPKLVITGVKLLEKQHPCTPKSALYTYLVEIKNVGDEPTTQHAPNGYGSGYVGLYDLHTYPKGLKGPPDLVWAGQQEGPTPVVQPGQAVGIKVDIPYYIPDPKHMVAFPTHPFAAIIDSATSGAHTTHWLTTWGPTVTVPAPVGCPRVKGVPPYTQK